MTQKLTTALCALLFSASTAFASGTHSDSHDNDMEIGRPGQAADVTRTVEISMVEPEAGGMAFDPGNLTFARGETVRFVVTNTGYLDHEIVFDTTEEIMDHAELMMSQPDMRHADPNALTLAPGETGDLIWTFSQAGTFQYACLIPGHMDAGMHGPLTVN